MGCVKKRSNAANSAPRQTAYCFSIDFYEGYAINIDHGKKKGAILINRGVDLICGFTYRSTNTTPPHSGVVRDYESLIGTNFVNISNASIICTY